MNLVEVFCTAAIGGTLVLGAALLISSLGRIALSTRRALLLSGLVVAAIAPLVTYGATVLGWGLRPSLESRPVARALSDQAVHVPAPPLPTAAPTPMASAPETVVAPVPTAGATAIASATPAVVAAPLRTPWGMIAAIAWILGVSLGFARIAVHLVRLRALRRSLEPCIDARAPGAFTSEVLRVPATVGILRPVVALPLGLLPEVDDTELAAILRHERAHVVRRDPLAGLIARVARAIHWANPLVHVAARRFDAACESIADGAAVSEHAALAPRYASCLVRLAERIVVPTAVAGVHGIVGGRGDLTRRVEALLDPARRPDPRPSRLGRVAAVALGLAATTVLVCCCRGRRPLSPECCDEPVAAPQPLAVQSSGGRGIRLAIPELGPSPLDLEILTAYAGLRNRESDPVAKELHYYPKLNFSVGSPRPVVSGFSPTAMSGTTFTDGMLTTAVDSAYQGKIVVYFEPGSRIEPDWLTGKDGSLILQVLHMIPGTGNVPVAPLPNGIEVKGDRILFTPAQLPLPNGQYSVAVFTRSLLTSPVGAVTVMFQVLHSFTVGSSDTVAPTVVMTSPVSGSIGGAPIVVTFSEEIDPASLMPYSIAVFEPKINGYLTMTAHGYPKLLGSRAGGASASGGFRVAWQPLTGLEAGRHYRVVVSGFAEGAQAKPITDLSGNPLAAPYVFEFTAAGSIPAPTTVSADERIRALEAEVVALKKQAADFQKQAADFQAAHARSPWKGPQVTAVLPPGAAASQRWLADLHSMKDAATRVAALAAVRDALGSTDPKILLAGLWTARWMGDIEYDHDDFHARILPHAKRPENDEVRRSARAALARVKADPADLPLLIDDAQTADRNDAETIAMDLTTLSGGAVQDATADAVLHLLRDGTDIRKAFVMRGLQSARNYAPRVEARLIEIVRSVDPHDYDSHYFFHFLASRWEAKSDAIVDLILDTVETGKGEIDAMLRGLAIGLSYPQKDRAASRLLNFVENDGAPSARHALLQTLAKIAGLDHVTRLDAIAANPKAGAETKRLATVAAKAAMARR